MDESLDVKVRAALESSRGRWPAIASRSGVSYSWLSKFVRGQIDNPGYATLMKLRSELSGDGGAPPHEPAAIAAACALCGSHVLPSDWDRLKTAPELEPSAAPEPREPANAPASAFLRGGRRDEDHSDSGFGALDDEGDALDDHVDAIGRLTGDQPKRKD